jgi:hypothetical protein
MSNVELMHSREQNLFFFFATRRPHRAQFPAVFLERFEHVRPQ